MLSLGIFAALAASTARRSLKLLLGSVIPPLALTATVIALEILVKAKPLLRSAAPFALFIVAHFECPDINLLIYYTFLPLTFAIKPCIIFHNNPLTVSANDTTKRQSYPGNALRRLEKCNIPK